MSGGTGRPMSGRAGGPTPVVIDTDPGIDDAIALALACASPELRILGVTATAGNSPVSRTATNALAVLEACGRPDIPVHAGAERPLRREPRFSEEIHGSDGLGDCGWTAPGGALATRTAAEFLAEHAAAHAGQLRIIALGPLTNVATALRLYRNQMQGVGGLVWMGGAYREPGNVTPHAEFNAWWDPDATAEVLGSGLPVIAVGLDVTRRCTIGPDEAAQLARSERPANRYIAAALRFYLERYRQRRAVAACAMHDPLAVAVACQPELVRTEPHAVSVETAVEPERGATRLVGAGAGAPVAVALDVDSDRLRQLLMARLLQQ